MVVMKLPKNKLGLWASIGYIQVAFTLIPDERPWVRFTLATPRCRSHHLRHTVPGFLGGLELETGLITKPGGCVFYKAFHYALRLGAAVWLCRYQ